MKTQQVTTQARWIEAFGADHGVPVEITALVAAGEAQDVSYRNDEHPSFGCTDGDGTTVRIWVAHVNVAQRESDEVARFSVSVENEDGDNQFLTVYCGEVVGEAIAAYRAARVLCAIAPLEGFEGEFEVR